MKQGKGFFRVCGMLLLLCGMLTLGALAATPGPGELMVELTYTGVPAGTAGVANGDPVAAGYVALLEDNVQVQVNGQLLTPIVNGEAILPYAFQTGKTYELAVQEGKSEPYYRAKSIPVSAQNVADAIAGGATITDTVQWVEWTKPVKVLVLDTFGNPAPAGTEVTVVATMDDLSYQTVEITKPTDANGEAVFEDLFFDPADPNMRNIYDDRILLVAQCGDTTIARFEQLMGSNIAMLTWPTAKVGGTVYDKNGAPAAGQRVASYSELMTPPSGTGWSAVGEAMAEQAKQWYEGNPTVPGSKEMNLFHFPMHGCVYYTATDSKGNYTLLLPEGVSADLCVDDAQYMPSKVGPVGDIGWYRNVVNYDYADKAFPHFTWARLLRQGDDSERFDLFPGLKCLESATRTCRPIGSLSGMDLTMGATEYTLLGRVLDAGKDFVGQIHLHLIGNTAAAAGMHPGGSICEANMVYEMDDGKFDKTDVKLVPGTYMLTAFPADGFQDFPRYFGYETVTLTIPAADVAKGVVDLGDIHLTPKPLPVTDQPGINIGRPMTGITGEGRGYLLTRMEKIADPAYGRNSYLVTLSYTAFHTQSDVNQLPSGDLEVRLPAGIKVNNPGAMTASGSSATGITLTRHLTNVPTRQTQSVAFSIGVEQNAAANYYALQCFATPNPSDDAVPELSSTVILQRLQINLNGPRRVAPATSFSVFGDITGAGDDAGVDLSELSGGAPQLTAVGAKKGRYYYFDVPGRRAGAYTFQARTDRDGVTESSNTMDVTVAPGGAEVKDVYVEASGMTYQKDARFNMVNYTAFVSPANLQGADFDVYVDLGNVQPTDTVNVQVLGVDYPAALDPATGYWKATISGYVGYGDSNIMLDVRNTYSSTNTQIGRLMLLF